MPFEGMQGSKTIHIEAQPETLWSMVSDVTRMGDWSPETSRAEGVDGATGPAVGARFKGRNQRGRAKWSTTCTVTASESGREFSFVVGTPEKPKTTWSYRFAASGSGTDVTESWQANRYHFLAKLITTPDKATAALNDGIAKTLEALRDAADTK
jgi:uncharacterized protein YndB with AHSA1/START domain